MRFRDKKSGAIYVVTTDDVLSMFQNDRYEVVEENKKNTVLTVLAIVGIITLVAGIAVLVYRYLSCKDYDDYDEDFDYEEDIFEE